MSGRTTSHLILTLLAALWAGMVLFNLEYLGRFTAHLLLVSVRWLQLLFVALSLYSGTLLLLGSVRRPPRRHRGPRPFVSILVPAKDEERVIEATLRGLAAQVYEEEGERRFEVIAIDDGSTDATPEILARLASALGLRVVRTPAGSRGKAAALNVGVAEARGQVLVVFDADARVGPLLLEQMTAALDDPRVGGVQARRLPYNGATNVLTRMQDDDFAIVQTAFQRAREAVGAFVTFDGNGMLLRRRALDDAGGWNEEALTENIDISVRLYLRGWRIRYCAEAVVWEEAVPALGALIRQRARWFEGSLRCLGQYLPAILVSHLPLRVRLDMFFYLAGTLMATLGLLTSYAYALAGLAGVILLFLRLPAAVMGAASLFFTASLLAAVAVGRSWHPAGLMAVLLRSALFALPRLIVVPLAIGHYVRTAWSGRLEWAKTVHLGEAAAEGASDPGYVSRV
ncbi:MAG: glycosyltransferase [bacterium]